MNALLEKYLGRSPVFAPDGDGNPAPAPSPEHSPAPAPSPEQAPAPAPTPEPKPAKVEGSVLADDPAKVEAAAKEKADAEAKDAADELKAETPAQKKERETKEAADKAKAEKDKKPEPKAPKDGYQVDPKAVGLPDGMEVDKAAKDAFDPVAKELDLTQEQYDSVVKVFAKVKAGELNQFAETVKGWEGDGKKDPEIGGAKYDQTVSDAREALKEFGNEKLRTALFYSGYGNHPELLRFCAAIGAQLRQGQGIRRQGGADKRDLASRLFPSTNK